MVLNDLCTDVLDETHQFQCYQTNLFHQNAIPSGHYLEILLTLIKNKHNANVFDNKFKFNKCLLNYL